MALGGFSVSDHLRRLEAIGGQLPFGATIREWRVASPTANGFAYSVGQDGQSTDRHSLVHVISSDTLFTQTTGAGFADVAGSPSGAWYSHAGAWVAPDLREGWFNGGSKATNTGSGTIPTPNATYIGVRPDQGDPWQGALAEIAVWDLSGFSGADRDAWALATSGPVNPLALNNQVGQPWYQRLVTIDGKPAYASLRTLSDLGPFSMVGSLSEFGSHPPVEPYQPSIRVERTFEVRIHDAGVTTPTDGTVDFTIPHARMIGPPQFGTSIIRPLDGRAEQLPYSVDAVDVSGELTAQLFSSGRPIILGRLAEVRGDPNGTGFQTLDIRRVSDVSGGSRPRFRMELSDERWVTANADLFERTQTIQVFPNRPNSALRNPWFGTGNQYDVAGTRAMEVVADDGDYRHLVEEGGASLSQNEGKNTVLRGDMVANIGANTGPTGGNFFALRAEINGTDRPVISWGPRSPTTPDEVLGNLITDVLVPREVWVYWPGGPTSGSQQVRIWPGNEGFLTSELAPYHLGGGPANPITPGELLENVYSGVYGGRALRYDQDAVDAIKTALPAADYGEWYRITQPVSARQFLEANVYQKHLVVPFVDRQGRVSPKLIHGAVTPTATLGAADIVREPTWDNVGREAVTRIIVNYQRTEQRLQTGVEDVVPLDEKRPLEAREIRTHDNIDDLGERVRTITTGANIQPEDVADYVDRWVAPIFEMFGDGPQTWRFAGRATDDAPEPGDLIALNLSELKAPNAATAARSGDRAVVVVERRRVYGQGAVSYDYVAYDSGPAAQP